MRNTNKKGFTIVELVVVVAVIAILAAVLIPTFSGIIAKANQSADQQAVTNMNKLLATSTEKADNVDKLVNILVAAGYKGELDTYFADYSLAWVKAENAVVLVQNDKIVYPAHLAGGTNYELITATLATDSEALQGGLVSNETVHIGSDISSDKINVDSTGNYAVDLNGNTLSLENRIQAYNAGSKLVVSNGVIESASTSCSVYSNNGGYVELNNVQVYGASGANTVQCYGGDLVLNNVVAAQHGNHVNDEGKDVPWYNSAVQVVNYIELQDNGKYKVLAQANATIDGGVYTGNKAIQISAPGGNVTIKAGTLTGTEYVINADFAPANYIDGANFESVITIDGGTLNGNIKISADTELVINGGTFNGDTIKIGSNAAVALTFENLSQFITAGSTVVINGETFTK